MTTHRFLPFLPLLLGLLGSTPARAGERSLSVGDRAHAELLAATRYPSATECGTCHPKHYRDWSVSQHAYTVLSPLHNALQATLIDLTNGTNGDFCIRCHTPVGMAMGEPHVMDPALRSPVSREGITCVVCHRVDQAFGKFNARTPLVEGGLHAPVFGPTGGEELARAIKSGDYLLRPTEGGGPGRAVHADARRLSQMSDPGFCGRCHDVTLADGFRLEEAFSEYKNSHAARDGRSCQDCHMGVTPGSADGGYEFGPAAIVGGVPTADRKLTNHMIVGPDESVVHPGIFPHSPQAKAMAAIPEWVSFDVKAGWGTDAFEDAVALDFPFPERWASADDRYDAREVLDVHLALLEEARQRGWKLLQKGYLLGDIQVDRADARGLKFRVPVSSGIDSHNVPTGFSAERQVFLRVTVSDAKGVVLFRSGDADADGNLRDLHSHEVNDGHVPLDKQLFSLQSRFLVRNNRGGEREQVLPVNHSLDPLPFLRPSPNPTVLNARPAGIRMHKMGIEPGGKRVAKYQVKREALPAAGRLRVKVELVAGMLPANLVQAMEGVGFLYGLSGEEIIARIIERHRVLAVREIDVTLKAKG